MSSGESSLRTQKNKNKPLANNLSEPTAPIFVRQSPEVGVLLLHSFTSTPYEMRELAYYLAKRGISVYAPLLAGHGTTPADLSKMRIEDWQESVEQAYLLLRQHVKKIFVVGSSFGGNLAFHLATKFTNPLSGIVSMGTPIKVRWQKFFKTGLYSYGLFKKNQKKRRQDYRMVYDEKDQVVYPVMPTVSLRRFFKFIKQITIPTLSKVTVPTLIIQSSHDRIVDSRSASYIHQNLAATDKRIFWMNGSSHALTVDDKRELLFNRIYHFIVEKAG